MMQTRQRELLHMFSKGLYWCTRDGRVFSPKGERIAQDNGKGYWNICLASAGGYRKRFYVHQIVWMFFMYSIPKGCELNHIDGDKGNNVLTNLELATHKENIAHAHRLGLINQKGEKNHRAILTDKLVLSIRREYGKGLRQVQIADKFKVSVKSVASVVHRHSWRHI